MDPGRNWPPPELLAGWWDSVAKPFIISFCQRFSCMLASKRLQNSRFFTKVVELALEDGNWACEGSCHQRLREMDPSTARGAAIRSHTPLLADELVPLSCGH